VIASTLHAAWTSAIVSDTSSWLRLPPLIGIRLASTARSPTSSGPLDPNYGGETGLQGLLPLNTHRFFQGLWRDGGSLAYWEERGGLNQGRGALPLSACFTVLPESSFTPAKAKTCAPAHGELSPRARIYLFVFVVHTMSAMAGAMQFSRVDIRFMSVNKELGTGVR
jgi:hypothetical protein